LNKATNSSPKPRVTALLTPCWWWNEIASLVAASSQRAVVAGPRLERPPTVPAHAWLLVDSSTGSVLAERNADVRLAPASLTKLMTTYLVFERLRAGQIHLNDTVLISSFAAHTRGSRMYLKADMQVPVEDLIKSMLVRSANDATVALAEHI